MSEHDELVKRLSKWLPALVLQEVAQAIERLEGEKADLERRATFIEHDHPQKLEPHFSEAMGLLTTRKAFRKSEIAQLLAEQMQQLAEARAREDDRQEAIRAVLKVLSTQREPHPDDDLQKLVNLACSLLDDALTDYVPEALAAPAPGTGGAERPTLTRPQREILHHTKWRAAGRMYCGARDDADIQSLIRLGYMRDCGTPGHLPDDDAYFTITETGLKALAAQQQESGE